MDTQTELTTVALTKCRTEPAVALYAAAPVSGYGHADDIVTYSFDLPESVSATVKSGSVIGSATVYLDGYEVGTVDLVTHKEYVSDPHRHEGDSASAVRTGAHPVCNDGAHACGQRRFAEP